MPPSPVVKERLGMGDGVDARGPVSCDYCWAGGTSPFESDSNGGQGLRVGVRNWQTTGDDRRHRFS